MSFRYQHVYQVTSGVKLPPEHDYLSHGDRTTRRSTWQADAPQQGNLSLFSTPAALLSQTQIYRNTFLVNQRPLYVKLKGAAKYTG